MNLGSPFSKEEWKAICRMLGDERDRRAKLERTFPQADQSAMISDLMRQMRSEVASDEPTP